MVHNCSTFQFSADDEICSQVAERPQNYLVPHPKDCTKFYSCQNLGWRGGWIAHLMDCPATTGFDTKLRICNYIKALPRCSKSKWAKFHMKSCMARKILFHSMACFKIPTSFYTSRASSNIIQRIRRRNKF